MNRMLLKDENAITLIALIITIIILIILAGVGISGIRGDSSISNKAIKEKEEYLKADLIEKIKLEKLAQLMDGNLKGKEKLDKLKEILEKKHSVNSKYIDNTKSKLEIKSTDGEVICLITIIGNELEIIEKVEGDYKLWEYDKGNRRITRYLGEDIHEIEEITIPNYIDGVWITRIRGTHSKYSIFETMEDARAETITTTNIKKIKISEGIENLETSAFYSCKNLETVEFPETLKSIDWGVFSYDESLKGDLTIPNNVESIGQCTFSGCTSLNGTLRLGEKIEIIGTYGFSGCNLKEVIINRKKEEVTIQGGQCKAFEKITWLK